MNVTFTRFKQITKRSGDQELKWNQCKGQEKIGPKVCALTTWICTHADNFLKELSDWF